MSGCEYVSMRNKVSNAAHDHAMQDEPKTGAPILCPIEMTNTVSSRVSRHRRRAHFRSVRLVLDENVVVGVAEPAEVHAAASGAMRLWREQVAHRETGPLGPRAARA